MASNDHDDSVPPYLDVADIVRVSKRSPKVVRNRIKQLGLTEKWGNKLVVSSLRLRASDPSLYEHLKVAALEGRLTAPERLPPKKAS